MLADLIAFGIVALAAGYVLRNAYRGVVAQPLTEWLLRRGRVKLAMRLRRSAGLFSKANCH